MGAATAVLGGGGRAMTDGGGDDSDPKWLWFKSRRVTCDDSTVACDGEEGGDGDPAGQIH
ncbi:hypothetical protein U1Q18_030207, partial [Sarracenia purpurea var. burkii]